jgi:hypothetical protein
MGQDEFSIGGAAMALCSSASLDVELQLGMVGVMLQLDVELRQQDTELRQQDMDVELNILFP